MRLLRLMKRRPRVESWDAPTLITLGKKEEPALEFEKEHTNEVGGQYGVLKTK